jgi:hypothetical protein
MSNQIFKGDISNNILFDLLEEVYIFKTDKYYALNSSSFKKATFKNLIEPFYENIRDAYHISKQFYLTRKPNYSRFITIIRQICKKNHIPFNSQIKYDKSSYDICYYIYFNE